MNRDNRRRLARRRERERQARSQETAENRLRERYRAHRSEGIYRRSQRFLAFHCHKNNCRNCTSSTGTNGWVTQQLRRDTEMLEDRQARLQQMAASNQTSRASGKYLNSICIPLYIFHYRHSRSDTETLGTRQAETYTTERREYRDSRSDTEQDRQRHTQQRDVNTETPEARQTRLQQMAASNQTSREVRMSIPHSTLHFSLQRLQKRHRDADRQRQRDVNPDLFEQSAVQCKMQNFHSKLEFYSCTSCLERFPNLANSTICARCNRDKRIPKLYSANNNMDPGPVPPQLQVSILNWLCALFENVGSHTSWRDAHICQ